MGKYIDMTSERYGRWTVIRNTGNRLNKHILWEVRCDCGTVAERLGYTLRQGASTSCGCYSGEVNSERLTKHGGKGTKAYQAWKNMRQRCANPNGPQWNDYGGRGITVCERWNDFANFLADMGNPPDGRSLDRIDNDKGYGPDNCRWATSKEQNRNKRSNHMVTYKGIKKPLSEWCEVLGVSYSAAVQRLLYLGYSEEEALSA